MAILDRFRIHRTSASASPAPISGSILDPNRHVPAVDTRDADHKGVLNGTVRAELAAPDEHNGLPQAPPDHAGVAQGGVTGGVEALAQKDKRWFAYFLTRDFYIVLVLGQVLALCITGTNTFTSLLAAGGTSIPAFQTFFNYVLLNIVYTGYTIFRYGPKKWFRLVIKDGWRFLLLAFFDVEGNYFVVLAYRYTNILSAQLINFSAIVFVVILSFAFLRVRYHWTQILGILICIGGTGVLIGSDHVTGVNGGPTANAVKGDLFALLGAAFYGLSNTFEEFLVSERPLYEVVGQLGFWGMLINGAQAGIFDRTAFQTATWAGPSAGYLVGYTLILFTFYSLAPILFRLSSAAFFNISLLTAGFWGVIIGVRAFGLTVHWMYPIAFVCIVGGLVVYFAGKRVLGEAVKPWLGRDQEKGVVGVGTARRKALVPGAVV
ncbi:MAG: hypothetical protein M1817_000901 [Caeruleum heppii]|nr:MAG: hypothetical protein M1817_000901 [Caeruleum heppii]